MPRRTEASARTMKFGARLRELRRSRNMSLRQVAGAGGLSRGHLSSMEHGLAGITIGSLERIATALDVPLLYIFAFGDTDERASIVELINDLPVRELVSLRKELTRMRRCLELQNPVPR